MSSGKQIYEVVFDMNQTFYAASDKKRDIWSAIQLILTMLLLSFCVILTISLAQEII